MTRPAIPAAPDALQSAIVAVIEMELEYERAGGNTEGFDVDKRWLACNEKGQARSEAWKAMESAIRAAEVALRGTRAPEEMDRRMCPKSEDGWHRWILPATNCAECGTPWSSPRLGEPASPPTPAGPSEAAEDAAVLAMQQCPGHYEHEDMKLEPLCMCEKCLVMLRAALSAAYAVDFPGVVAPPTTTAPEAKPHAFGEIALLTDRLNRIMSRGYQQDAIVQRATAAIRDALPHLPFGVSSPGGSPEATK
jgi:hypothetical protein